MKIPVIILLVVAIATPALATPVHVEGSEVLYVGGSVTGLAPGTLGSFDLTNIGALAFQCATGKTEIPYASVTRYEITEQLAHHLGVLPTIAVGLVKRRQRRHFLRIEFKDAAGTPQAAVFEISKEMPAVMQSVLNSRAHFAVNHSGEKTQSCCGQ